MHDLTPHDIEIQAIRDAAAEAWIAHFVNDSSEG